MAQHRPSMRLSNTDARDDVTLLKLPTDAPLGAAHDIAYRPTAFEVPPGATLRLYTDGLVEDHRYPIDLGISDLCKAIRTAPADHPAGVLEHVLDSAVGPHPRRDDIALLCLIRSPAPGGDQALS